MPSLDFDTWLKIGYDNGWCGPPICSTHDGLPTTTEEDTEFDDGGDPCLHILRLYEDKSVKAAVEQNHSASQWRASNMGLVSRSDAE